MILNKGNKQIKANKKDTVLLGKHAVRILNGNTKKVKLLGVKWKI